MSNRSRIIQVVKDFDWSDYGLDNVAETASDDWARDLADRILDALPAAAAAGPAPAEPDDRIETEAWRLVLAGAESHCEDAVNEDPDDDLSDDEFDQVRDRAMAIISELRSKNGV